MAELLSIMKSDCRAVTVTTVSVKLENFSKPMMCRKQPIWFKPLVTVTQDRSCERAKRNLCACACTKASLWSCVCVCVNVGTSESEWDCARMQITLFCISKHNFLSKFNRKIQCGFRSVNRLKNTSEDPLNQRLEDIWSKTKKITTSDRENT